jgi:hypothetical protein
MSPRRRSRFERSRRRQALAAWSFLRPAQRTEEDRERFEDRLRETPALLREYRSSLALQMAIIGILVLSCVFLFVQSVLLLRTLESVPSLSGLVWAIPTLVAGLGLVALRRFLRVLSEFRKLGNG